MKYFKRFFDGILFGNVYVAIATVCLIQSSRIQLGIIDHLITYSTLCFFATIFVYNLQRIFYAKQSNNAEFSIRRKWIFENQFTIKLLVVAGFLGVVIMFFFNDPQIIFYLSPLLILSIAYFFPGIKLRKNSWFKLLTLTFVWTLSTSIIPALLNNVNLFSTSNILHFSARLFFMLGICVPFDLRDIEIDKKENVITLAQKFGENKTRVIGVCCLLIHTLLVVLQFLSGAFSIKIFIALLISACISCILVSMSNSKRGEYFYIAGIDGTMILQGVLVMFVELM